MDVIDGSADFLAHCRLQLGLSANTISAYRRDLARLHQWCENTQQPLAQWQPDTVAAWLGWLEAEGLQRNSRRRALSALRHFVRFLLAERKLAEDRVHLVRSPQPHHRLPEVLTRDEVDRLLANPPPGPLQARDRAALELLYACGGRASEVVGIGLADLREGGCLVKLRGKGNKERLVPLGERAQQAVKAYLSEMRPTLEGGRRSELLLLGSRGRALSRQTLWAMVRKAGVLAGLGNRVYTHLLRHTFATHVLEGGADLRVVQELLGHANLSTTQRYTQVDAQRLKDLHSRFHPRA